MENGMQMTLDGFSPEIYQGADCWCFGFPCQDISVAGKQTGLAGNRSGLFYTVIKLLEDTEEKDRPSVLFIENIKNLLSVNMGYDFLTVLTELDKIGYDAEWQVINSAGYVPQNRERIFIIGHLRGRSAGKVFPIEGTGGENSVSIIGHRDGYRRNSQTYSADGITEALDTGTGGGRGFNVAIPILTPDRAEKRQNGRRFKENGEPMFTLTGQDRHGIFNGYRIRKLTPKECFRLSAGKMNILTGRL